MVLVNKRRKISLTTRWAICGRRERRPSESKGILAKSWFHRHAQYFSNMKRLAISVLCDLLTATETIGEYDRVWARGAHRRQQDTLSERL